MNISGKWAVVTALAVCVTAVNAQDKSLESDAANHSAVTQDNDIPAPQNKVVRYSAGDSIPIGVPLVIRGTTRVDSVLEKPPVSQNQVVRYSAGDSIPMGYPAVAAADKEKTARKKSGGYSNASNLPLAGALGDSVTTHIGLGQAGLAEGNGLINVTPAGLVGLFVVKAGVVYYLEQQSPAVRKSGLKTAAGVWSGFTMNNLLLIAGSTNPVSILGGALFGAYMYHREGIALDKQAALRSKQEFNAATK